MRKSRILFIIFALIFLSPNVLAETNDKYQVTVEHHDIHQRPLQFSSTWGLYKDEELVYEFIFDEYNDIISIMVDQGNYSLIPVTMPEGYKSENISFRLPYEYEGKTFSSIVVTPKFFREESVEETKKESKEETDKEIPNSEIPNQEKPGPNPETGDEFNLLILVGVIVFALLAFLVIGKKKRRN